MQNPPRGYTRVCPYLLYEDASRAVEYLTQRSVSFSASSRRAPPVGFIGNWYSASTDW